LIRSKRGLISVGVLTLITGLVIMLPARLAVHWFVPSEVAISGIQGSAWSGSASEASVAGIYLRDVQWEFAPLRLFSGALSYEVSATPVSGFVETNLSIGIGGSVSLNDVSASLPLELFAGAAGIRGLQGSGSFQFERVQIVDGLAVVADGTIQIANLMVPVIGNVSLGGYKAEFFTQNNGISASIEDTDGVVELARFSGYSYPVVFAVEGSRLTIGEGDDYDLSRLLIAEIDQSYQLETMFEQRFHDYAYTIRKTATHAYVVADDNLLIIDVSNINVRQPLAQLPLPVTDYPTGFEIVNGLAYASDEDSGLRIFDISDTDNMQLLSTLPLDESILFDVSNDDAFMVSGYDFVIADVSNPNDPLELSVDYYGFQDSDFDSAAIINDQYALVSTEGYLDFSDIFDPANPVNIAEEYFDDALSIDGWGEFALLTYGNYGFDVYSLASGEGLELVYASEIEAEFGALDDGLAYVVYAGELSIVAAFPETGSEFASFSDSLAPGGEADSIRHHRFTLTETRSVLIDVELTELSSAQIYLFEVTGGELSHITTGDNVSHRRIKGITTTLDPGTYDVAVARYNISLSDAYGTFNSRTWHSGGAYELKVTEPVNPLLSSLDFEGTSTSIDVVGDFAYVNTQDSGIYVIDIRDPYDPFLAGRHDYTGYSVYEEDRFIGLDNDKLVLFDPYEGLVIVDPTPDLVITGQTSIGDGIEYQLAWTIDRGQVQPQVKCAVIVGDCVVTDVNHANRTATVNWRPSEYSGTYGIMFALGNSNSFVSTRARLRWQGALGENLQPQEIEVDRFYGVLAENGLYGSVQHHVLSIDSNSVYRYEVTSSGFASQIHLHQYEKESSSRWARWVWMLREDSNATPDVFEDRLTGGLASQLSLGSFPLGISDADRWNYVNSTEGPLIGDGLYEIRGYQILGGTDTEPVEP
jgi:hypothetical protein